MSDSEYLVTFAVMLMVSLVISTLTTRIKRQVVAARERERRTASLYAMSRELANSRGTDTLIQIAAQHIGELFDARVSVILADRDGHLRTERYQAKTRWPSPNGFMSTGRSRATERRLCPARGGFISLSMDQGTSLA